MAAALDAELERLYRETGDARFAAALAALSKEDARDRDRLVCEFADRHARHLWSDRAKAALLDRLARRYLTTAWLRHREHLRLPAELRGRPEEFVWRILKAAGAFPGFESLRKILRNR